MSGTIAEALTKALAGPKVDATAVAKVLEEHEQAAEQRRRALVVAEHRYDAVLDGYQVVEDRTTVDNVQVSDLFQTAEMAHQGRWACVAEIVTSGRRMTLRVVTDWQAWLEADEADGEANNDPANWRMVADPDFGGETSIYVGPIIPLPPEVTVTLESATPIALARPEWALRIEARKG